METNINKSRPKWLFNILCLMVLITALMACSKNDEGNDIDAVYSGTRNFNVTGDFNESF